ncbi:MAG TPA: pitrilysin family protein [Pyrinomonadaceae bacterium]|nr:pitrilysin family protein [Pyrinomonadaceae bacterium]
MNFRDSVMRKIFYAVALAALTLAFLSVSAAAQTPPPVQAATPPPPAEPRSPQFPTPVERTLANGLRVVVIERRTIPLAAANLVVKTGGEADPRELAGLADMTATLLTKGTKTRTAPQIVEQIESLGGSISSGARWDASEASVGVQSTRLAPALEILADVLRNPVFDGEEIERLRQQYLDDLQVSLSQPGAIARYVSSRVVFGDEPYGHPLSGTPESLPRISRNDFIKFHQTYYRPDNAVLVVGGDVRADDVFKLAEKLFGNWAKPAGLLPMPKSASAARRANAKPRVVVIDKPDAGQAAVLVARLGINRRDPDFFRGIVTNSVLSGYSGRLNQEIRIKRGLSYGAGSALDVRRDVGPFSASAQTKNESGAEVANLLLGELSRLAAADVPEAELVPRKAVIIGGFARNLETVGGLVSTVAALAVHGLPFDTINNYINNVQSVTPADVRRFAGSRLASKETSVVIVGNAKEFLPELRKHFPQVEVIPVSELDLNTAALRRAAKATPGGTK